MANTIGNSKDKFIIPKTYAAVTVCVKDGAKTAVVQQGSFCLVDAGTAFVSLKDKVKITDEDGNELEASGKFYESAESFDPYHLLID